jgi:hypothetical protein
MIAPREKRNYKDVKTFIQEIKVGYNRNLPAGRVTIDVLTIIFLSQ